MSRLVKYFIFTSVVGICLTMPVPDSENVDHDSENSIDEDVNYFAAKLAAFGKRLYDDPKDETGELVAKWDNSSGVNPEELGEYVEGDILFPMARNGLAAQSARWPDGKVYYQISSSFSRSDVDLFKEAFNHYHQFTCIKFIPYTGKESDYIYITKDNTGCWSSVGRAGGRQELNLQSPGCTSTVGTPIHELMHALGFLHEQNRWERDEYVTINWQNIQSGRDDNFKAADKATTDDFGVKYDYNSVMHYSANAFSVNGRPTIEPKDRNAKLGQRKGLSRGDITKINKMYKCKKGVSSGGSGGGGGGGGEMTIGSIIDNISSIFG